MSVKSMNVKNSKTPKPLKLERYSIDVLAVYSSENETPVPLELAMKKIHELLQKKSGTAKLKIQKSTLQIWGGANGSHNIVIKSSTSKSIFETFPTKSMGIPQIGQLASQDLVFLPVLSKDYKSELFVFHPKNASAQEVVIRLVKLIQLKDNLITEPSLVISMSPPKSEAGDIIPTPAVIDNNFRNEDKRVPNELDDEYSLTSSFFNNWYCKVEQMVSNTPTSLYQGSDYGSSINDELQLLNQYLKEIRAFMNNFYDIMHKAVLDSTIENDIVHRVAKLPTKVSFVEIIQKVKYSLNIAAVHESMIMNPNAKEIVNQLVLILKILADATTNKLTGRHDLVVAIKDPEIIETTTKYLISNLNAKNKEFWMSLGRNYGYLEPITPVGLPRTLVDEFEIRRETVKENQDQYLNHDRYSDRRTQRSYEMSPVRNYDREWDKVPDNKYYKHYSSDNDVFGEDSYSRKRLTLSQPQISFQEKSRSELNDDLIYRSYPRMYDPDTEIRYSPDPFINNHHQRNERIIPNGNDYGRHGSSTWENAQCRFIDAVQLRNGRLMKITRDRPAQTNREIAVSCNETVELLSDHGDMVMVKNALGEVGYCPSSIAQLV